LLTAPDRAAGEEMTVKHVRIHRPRIRRERPWLDDLPADPRDPDVVRVKALARAQQASSSRPAALGR
jgi:hypothetical protein